MKKFDKNNFKKLALLGIAGGAAMATPGAVEANDLNSYSNMLAYKCGSGSCGGFTAYRSVPSQNSYYYNNGQGQQAQSGCGGGGAQWQQPQSGCHSAQQWQQPQGGYYNAPQWQQPQSGCGGAAQWQQPQQQPQTAQWQNQPSGSCNSPHGCHGTTQPTQPSSGCGGSSAPQATPPAAPAQPSVPPQSAMISRWESSGYTADASKGTAERTMTESDLLSQLNEQGKASYQRLDAAGKALALKLANQSCKGQNECKGLNSCKTSEHTCAGKGSCAGTSDSNFKDKNLAVKVATMKMADKRANATSPKY